MYGVFSRDMAAMLVSLKKGTVTVVSPTNHLEIELYSYANVLFRLKTMLIDHSISLDGGGSSFKALYRISEQAFN